MTASRNRPYIPEIDQLRGLAALLVFFYHSFQLIGARLAHGTSFDAAKHWVFTLNPVVAVIEEGHVGVGLFIVLSGFVLSIGTIGRRIDYPRFLAARALRIYPVLILMAVAADSANPQGGVAFLLSLLPIDPPLNSDFTAMFWAVAVEFQCYFVFPFLILFSDRQGTRFLLRVILVGMVLRLLAVMSHMADAHDVSYWTVLGRLDQFCIGMIAARWWVFGGAEKLRSPAWLLLASVMALGIIACFNQLGGWPARGAWKILWPTVEGAMWAVFVVCYVGSRRIGPRLPMEMLRRFGVISYSFYLIHRTLITVALTHGVYIRATGNGYYDALLTAAFCVLPVGTLVAALLYGTVEQPFLGLRPKYLV